ncbi:MAG: PKD domain-containing protein, partial [bacterium]|nr:PKD domain-containing protein [bacterium]
QGGGAAGGVGMTNGLVRNCVIEECGAGGSQGYGAGVFCLGAGVVENSRIRGNFIDGDFGGYGAGAYLQGGGLLRNCLIVANESPSPFSEGGGVYAKNGGTLVNCTISGNTAGRDGSGLACNLSNVVVHNTIIYYNTSDNYFINPGAYNPRFSYCALTPARAGTGNLSSDPRFVNNSVGDYHLLSNSPCVNAGSTATYYVGATDVAGNPRLTDGMVDMGAYEFGAFDASFTATPRVGIAPLVVAFSARVSGSNTLAWYQWDFNNDGIIETQGWQLATPQHSYTNTGIYSPGVLVSNSVGECAAWFATDYIVVLASNVMFAALDGGNQWPYNSWASAAKNIQDAIDTSQSGYTVLLSNGIYRLTSPVSIAKAVTVRSVQGRAATVLDGQGTVVCVQLGNGAGLTISNGYGVSVGGIWLVSGTARNCLITGNKSYDTGAGVLFSGSGRVEDCLIVGNGGGGRYNSDPTDGGGVAFDGGGTLERCVVMDNQGYQFGGIYISGSGAVIRNCLVARNQGLSWMGGVGGWGISATLENNTIVENTAVAGHAAGVNIGGGTLRNNIIYYNTVAGAVSNIGSGMGPFTYTCTWPGYAGTGNLTNDPRMVNRAARNYQLSGRSDCINAGANQSWMNTTKDLGGTNRIMNGVVDMGAYELATNSPLLRVQPALLNFGTVVLDQTASRALTVRNVGGGILTGALSGVAAPFAVSGASAYAVAINSSATLTLQFTPDAVRGYTNAVVATGGDDATIMLYGLGVPEPALLLPLLLLLLLGSGFRVQGKMLLRQNHFVQNEVRHFIFIAEE